MRRTAQRRLLVVAQPLEAGVPRHIFDLVRSLDPEEYAIDVACPRTSDLWELLDGVAGVQRHAIGPHRRPDVVDAAAWARLSRLVRDADVIHAHSSKAGFLARLAAVRRRRTRACVFTPHGWSFWSAQGARAHLFTAIERRAARWCRAIVAVSEDERRAGLAAGIGTVEQYRVVVNGIDLTRFAAPPTPVPGRVLMIGRLAPPKRPDVALRAVAALGARFPGLELHLVGDGPRRPQVEALIAELRLGDRIRLLGRRRDVPALLATAACVIVASDYEASPLTVIEAMAAGVPVVATCVGGVPELVTNDVSGLLVEPGCADALASAVATLLADPDRARRLGDAGRRQAQARHSRQAMAQAVAGVYREIAGEADAARPRRGGERR